MTCRRRAVVRSDADPAGETDAQRARNASRYPRPHARGFALGCASERATLSATSPKLLDAIANRDAPPAMTTPNSARVALATRLTRSSASPRSGTLAPGFRGACVQTPSAPLPRPRRRTKPSSRWTFARPRARTGAVPLRRGIRDTRRRADRRRCVSRRDAAPGVGAVASRRAAPWRSASDEPNAGARRLLLHHASVNVPTRRGLPLRVAAPYGRRDRGAMRVRAFTGEARALCGALSPVHDAAVRAVSGTACASASPGSRSAASANLRIGVPVPAPPRVAVRPKSWSPGAPAWSPTICTFDRPVSATRASCERALSATSPRRSTPRRLRDVRRAIARRLTRQANAASAARFDAAEHPHACPSRPRPTGTSLDNCRSAWSGDARMNVVELPLRA